MTAYEFTRFESDFTTKMKAKALSIDTVKFSIEYNNPDKDLCTSEKYKDAEDIFIESTMSCTKIEAIEWMKYYMANAIAYGIQTKDTDWMYFFLAAYNIFTNLVK